ncbi:MAG: hypothetical protein JSR31_10575 [Nitrospira sp.]|nr:hypothetical protein [Nitrospira sp.]
MVPTLHLILTGSTAAKHHARRLLGVGSHEHNQALLRFAEEIQQAEDALIHSIETPSFTDIFDAIDCAIGWAEKFGTVHDQPEAARTFRQDLKRVSLELQTACQTNRSFQQTQEGIPTDTHLYAVLSWVTKASSYARFVAVRQANYAMPLQQFQEELQRIQGTLQEAVNPSCVSEEEARRREWFDA